MGWSYGFINGRDVGYGVPAICDQPGCDKEIDRGLAFVCGGNVGGEPNGCGLFFCYEHLAYYNNIEHVWSQQLCDVCGINYKIGDENYKLFVAIYDAKPDTEEWCHWKLADKSWSMWRKANPKEVKELEVVVAAAGEHSHDWSQEG